MLSDVLTAGPKKSTNRGRFTSATWVCFSANPDAGFGLVGSVMGKIIPSSRAYFTARVSMIDAIWAAAAPLLVLAIRDMAIPPSEWLQTAGLYWGVSFTASIFAFLVFRLRDGLMRYFSVHDALDVVKAVACAELLICLAL